MKKYLFRNACLICSVKDKFSLLSGLYIFIEAFLFVLSTISPKGVLALVPALRLVQGTGDSLARNRAPILLLSGKFRS
jgi:hypothetical protein